MLRIAAVLLLILAGVGAARADSKPDPQALYKAGFDARVAGNYDAAIRLLSAAIASGKLNDDDRASSYNNRGMAYAATDQPDKAVADYTMAIKIAPVYGPAYLNRGNVYLNAGRYDEAIADFNRAIITSSKYALAYNSRGSAYYEKGNAVAALADLDTAIKLKPDYANAYWNRARVHAGKGDFAAARADFDKAIELKPQDADLYENRAEFRSALDDNRGAITDYDKALALDPSSAPALNGRGNSYFALGQTDKALADFDSAIKIDPDYGNPYTNRGRIALFHGNRPADAAKDLATAVRLNPDDDYAVLWLHIARVRAGVQDHHELAANAAKLDASEWPHPLVALFLGETDPAAVRRAAQGAAQNCEADFYLGMFELEKNGRDEAKKLISSAASGCPGDMLEKAAAAAELARWPK